MPRNQRKFEVPRHDSDDYIGLAIQQDLRAQNLFVAMKALLPDRVAQNRDLLAVLGFVRGEHAAKMRLNGKRRKHAGGQAGGVHLSWLTVAG